MLEHGSGSALSVSKKSAWNINKFSISSIAISLGSYMDKAVGRRACTRKNVRKDVSALSGRYLGIVSVISRSCFGVALLMSH